jgi:hypothetical protein
MVPESGSTGGVHIAWFLNAGLSQQTGDAMLSITPIYGSLKQGAFFLPEQFGYRFNTDGKSIIAALTGFHVGNLRPTVFQTAAYQCHCGFCATRGACESRPSEDYQAGEAAS